MSKHITINGKSYDAAQLTAEARSQINNLQAADAELQRLSMQQAFVGTARNAYANALAQELAKLEPSTPTADAKKSSSKGAAAKKAAAKKSKA